MKLKRKMTALTILMMVVVLSLAGCSEGTPSASKGNDSTGVIEMNINNSMPSTHHFAINIFEPWAKLVEEKTEGKVKVNLYHGGTLGGSASILQDVQGGVYDVGAAIGSYHYDSELFPYSVGLLPYVFPNSEVGTKLLNKFAEKYDVKVRNVLVLGAAASDRYDFYSTKPISKFDDLKGKKIRVQGKGDSELAVAWQGTPVSMTTDEVYEGLERGMVDLTPYSSVGILGSKLYEVAPYILKLEATGTVMIPLMNESFYNNLPEELREVFDEELNPRLLQLFQESYSKEFEKAQVELEKLVEKKGGIIEFPPEEIEKFQVTSEAQWDKWVKDADARGYDGKEMVAELKKMLSEEGVTLPF